MDEFTREAERLKAHGWDLGDIIDFFNQVTHQRLTIEARKIQQQKDQEQWRKNN